MLLALTIGDGQRVVAVSSAPQRAVSREGARRLKLQTEDQSNEPMSTLPTCPKCHSQHTYEDGPLLVCPECAHEWSGEAATATDDEGGGRVVKDAVGNVLSDGDSVTVIKDLKIKGSSSVVKIGTKVRNIRLVDGTGGHDIDCKIDGIGPMQLKSEFVKKA